MIDYSAPSQYQTIFDIVPHRQMLVSVSRYGHANNRRSTRTVSKMGVGRE